MRRLPDSRAEAIAKRSARGYDGKVIAEKKPRRKRVQLISPEQVLRELPASKLVVYDAGTFIFRENSRGTDCFLIVQGRARILKRSARGEDIPLALVKPGDFLGEMSMLSGEKRSASVVALTRQGRPSVCHPPAAAIQHAAGQPLPALAAHRLAPAREARGVSEEGRDAQCPGRRRALPYALGRLKFRERNRARPHPRP